MSEAGKKESVDCARELAAHVTSEYQLDTFRDTAETSTARLKASLQAAFAAVGFVNREVKSVSRPTAFLDLELDSIVCMQLHCLRLELLRAFQRIFADFEAGLKTTILKNFNVSEADLRDFAAARSVVDTSSELCAKPPKTRYQSYEKFLADVPSNAPMISVPQARH